MQSRSSTRGFPEIHRFRGRQTFRPSCPQQRQASASPTSIPDITASRALRDSASATIAGSTTTALVLPRQTSAGECRISLSDPSVNISVVAPDLELSVDATIAADRYLNRNKSMIVPLALGQNGADLNIDWYVNGAKVQGNQSEACQGLPGFRILLGSNDAANIQTTMKMEALLTEAGFGLPKVLSHASCVSLGPVSASAEWIQSIDYHAAMGSSVFQLIRRFQCGDRRSGGREMDRGERRRSDRCRGARQDQRPPSLLFALWSSVHRPSSADG